MPIDKKWETWEPCGCCSECIHCNSDQCENPTVYAEEPKEPNGLDDWPPMHYLNNWDSKGGAS